MTHTEGISHHCSMSMADKLISFVVKNNIPIIEVTVALIIIFSMYLAVKYFLNDEMGTANQTGTDLSQLEETIKKLLDQKPTGLSLEQAAEYEALQVQVVELKTQMEAKQKELEEAKKQTGAQSGLSDDEKNQLHQKLKDLESRLSEYEIISEDIADLSRYKEENKNLKAQIESFKKSGAETVPVVTSAPVQVEAPPAPQPPPPVAAEAPAGVTSAPSLSDGAPAPVAVAAAPGAPDYIDDDIMAEFAKAVEMQQSGSLADAPTPPTVAPVIDESANEKKEEEESASALNLEKMDAEAETIQSAAESDVAPANALEGEMNEDKLISEATQFGTEVNDDANVMNQFNNFVKSDGST